ncbi:serine hydrolase domain-containing protein [Polaribacter sargassicola]|uniref:serine hydrolase domain-containing protein n=1 Tax=Polaribacter sargassicola TaxID=2836891 RepID=UPI001F2E139C|nr:serine hydrolase [Polaribacter sp. DS7-9]MCG1034775.1 beta-lactamase family protein [Polaribacter sp. DS7-9]
MLISKRKCTLLIIIFISSLTISQNKKLSYGNPSEVNMDSLYIHTKVDSIVKLGIQQEAFPGARILVAKNHKIIFDKAYGYHTYDSLQKVNLDDMYDLASVTKIIGPLLALMKLHSEGKLDLDSPFSNYWKPWKKRKDKKNLTFREVLAHQAGLNPYIVFLNEIYKKNGKIKKRFIKNKANNRFKNEAYDSLFVKNRFKNKMFRQINRSKVSDVKKYKYSGLSFLIYPDLISQITKEEYTNYLEKNFYFPLSANTLGYRPKTKNFKNLIVPTEIDTIFRKGLTKNWVHDENAALLGGISGNAGLFGTALDLAKVMQMYANYGIYDGKRYISESTLKEFTKIQYPENDNRRGLGFDKPSINNAELPIKKAYPAPEVSPESFGHSGFTGTFVWADPKNDLIFIFLSNRVYPNRNHRNIYNLNIRPKLQQIFYKAIKE